VKGFFAESDLIARRPPPALVPRCGLCKLYETCRSPKMPVDGEGRKQILIVGEAPGKNEDLRGKPFVGASGEYLQRALRAAGVDLRRDCWITNALICRPSGNVIEKPQMVDWCRPNVIKAITTLKPRVILLLGKRAAKSVLGWLWRPDAADQDVHRWVGWQIPCQKLNAYICPAWHPAHILRANDEARGGNEVMERMFAEHVRAAVALEGRPWPDGPPDHKGKVTVEADPDKAAALLDRLAAGSRPLAVDYETTTLKPDGPHARIVSFSASDGRLTVSCPWAGAVRRAALRLLRSPLPKIASNLKFEERWTLKEFGKGVRNWAMDTMQAAHVLDNRRGITSIKFLAWVLLGEPEWDAHVAPFLHSDAPNLPNRIGEVRLESLLLYGGLDSLLEWKVARKQARQLGVRL